MSPRDRISASLRLEGEPSIVAFLTAGYPDPEAFVSTLRKVAAAADAVEIGVPFTDPMADGVTIQRSSEKAIANGVNLHWIFERLKVRDGELEAPILLMSYLNPLLAFGYEALADQAVAIGVDGFIVPDLPFEESEPMRRALEPHGLALVQLVTPLTSNERMKAIVAGSQGFVYAVTRSGITGSGEMPAELASYLSTVRSESTLPVCAGFGVRTREHVSRIGEHADGVIVGTALVEALERGEDPAEFLDSLRRPAP